MILCITLVIIFKENPLIGKGKKNKNLKISSDASEGNEIRTFIILIVVIVLFIGALYGITELLNKKETTKEEETAQVEINYDKISVGNIFGSSYKNYYVLIYDSEDTKSPKYATLLNTYMGNSNKEDYKKIYFCDLENKINKDNNNVNNDNKNNNKEKKIADFDFADFTLLEIKNKEIVNYVEGYDNIKEILNK